MQRPVFQIMNFVNNQTVVMYENVLCQYLWNQVLVHRKTDGVFEAEKILSFSCEVLMIQKFLLRSNGISPCGKLTLVTMLYHKSLHRGTYIKKTKKSFHNNTNLYSNRSTSERKKPTRDTLVGLFEFFCFWLIIDFRQLVGRNIVKANGCEW